MKKEELVESSVAMRVTDGIDWISKFSGSDLKLLFILTGQANSNNIVELSPSVRKVVYETLDIKYQMFRMTLRSLISKGALKRMERDVFFINPLYTYNGDTDDIKKYHETIEIFNNYKSK